MSGAVARHGNDPDLGQGKQGRARSGDYDVGGLLKPRIAAGFDREKGGGCGGDGWWRGRAGQGRREMERRDEYGVPTACSPHPGYPILSTCLRITSLVRLRAGLSRGPLRLNRPLRIST